MQYKLLIDGELIAGPTSFDVINPATGTGFAKCPKADVALLDRAVDAAQAAFPVWSALSADARADMLMQLAAKLEERAGEFANLLTLEQGKPLDQAMGEIIGCTFILRAFAKRRLETRTLRNADGNTVIEHRTPLGVCAAITPWNFPMVLLMNKLGPALITGNTMLVKPAPTTPLTTLLFGEICAEVLPRGVVNIICDENDLGVAITAHSGIDKVAFTGSTATGKKVMASAAGTVKRVTLELGGNDAAIVLEDVDPKVVAQKIYNGAMTNAGQICVAIKRAYVPRAIYDEFCEELGRIANEAVVDDGSKQGTTIGPVQNRMQFERVCELIDDAKNQGTILSGGAPLDRPGYYIPPTIVRDLPNDARLVKEEQFGPVLPVLCYDEIDEVITQANDSEFGLGGTVWSRDTAKAIEVAKRIDTGTVWVNQYLAIDPDIPFRGCKQSGLGAELGEAGLLEYTQAHVINAIDL